MRDLKRAVVYTLYQRPFYTRQTLGAWRNVRGVRDWDFLFHIDPSDQSQAQIEIAHEFLRWHRNGSVQVHAERLGVLEAPFFALSNAFDQGYDRVVLAEEDVEVADDVLEYIDKALWSVDIACAWTDEDGAEEDFRVRRKWFNPWLWATTEEAWYRDLKDTWDHDYSSADERGPGGWDCNIGLRLVHDRDLDVAFPCASRSRHIGKHLGAHQDPSQHGAVEMPPSFRSHRDPVEWDIDLREYS